MNQVRLTVVVFLLALGSQFAVAQNKFDGSWKASLVVGGQRCGISLIMQPAQRYSETVRCGSMMTRQSGTYVVSNGLLIRNVMDWDPKQRYVMDNGYSGHWETNAKPPGGSYRVNFVSPNSMVWHDVNFGGNITFRRSQ